MDAPQVNASIESLTASFKAPAGPSWQKSKLLEEARRLYKPYDKMQLPLTPENRPAVFEFVQSYIEFMLLNSGMAASTRKEVKDICTSAIKLFEGTEYSSRLHCLKGKFHHTVAFLCITAFSYYPEGLLEAAQMDILKQHIPAAEASYYEAVMLDAANARARLGYAEVTALKHHVSTKDMKGAVETAETQQMASIQRTLPNGKRLMSDIAFTKHMQQLLTKKGNDPVSEYKLFRRVRGMAQQHGHHVMQQFERLHAESGYVLRPPQ